MPVDQSSRPRPPMSSAAEFAFKVLEVIADSGYVLAPADPTPAMLEAAVTQLDIGARQAADVYRAMLAAA